MSGSAIKSMRDAFIARIYDRMRTDESIFFVSADFGAPLLDKLRADYKGRFINVGIAEQNLINVVTGIALEGYTVYAYLIAPFIMRAYEQIRVNLAMSSHIRPLNVNIVAVGVGLSYVVSGPTHHCYEDLSIMRLLPNFMVLSPSDWKLAESFADYSVSIKKPKILRFDGKPMPYIYEETGKINLDNGFHVLIEGDDICLVTTGVMTHSALEVAKRLLAENAKIGVVDVFILKPTDKELLFNCIKRYKHVITIEESFINNGGLDCLLSNIITDRNAGIRLHRMGINDKYIFDIGSREYLHKLNDINVESIIKKIKSIQI